VYASLKTSYDKRVLFERYVITYRQVKEHISLLIWCWNMMY